ncbi:triphosphoribosyl-dephospho-CoA synthase, partial [Pseudomonas agarici]
MHAFNLQAQPWFLAERLADFAVRALIDEADLSPKPALVDRRGNGAHSDLHLGLMHASALSLWPMFKAMAEAAIASPIAVDAGYQADRTAWIDNGCAAERRQAGSAQYPGLPRPAALPPSSNVIDLSLREALGRIGREGEQTMLQTTGGVNTHRGAIWALGLLVAGAALDPRRVGANAITRRAACLALLEDRYAPDSASHGRQVAQRYGARGAREEAQSGF